MRCFLMCKTCRYSLTSCCCKCRLRCQCICRCFLTCCRRGTTFCRRHCRFVVDIFILYVLTFVVVIPMATLKLRHTPFDFIKEKNVTTENERMLKENAMRYNQSLVILQRLLNSEQNSQSQISRNLLGKSTEQSALIRNETPDVKKGLAITIITVKRSVEEERDPRYLTQVVASFLKLIQENEPVLRKLHIHFSICNVDDLPDTHAEVRTLPQYIPVYTRYQYLSQNLQNKRVLYVPKPVLQKEKDDYSYCLDRVLEQNLSHSLLVEDDAMPKTELFIVLNSLIFSSVQQHQSNVIFYKLYHPERLLGYISLEPERIVELLSLGALLSCFLTLMYTKWRVKISTPLISIWLTFFIYGCLVFLSIGRANIVELRRISSYFYQMTPSPSCCTPAMLFTRNGGKQISSHLKTVIDTPKLPKDMAISKYIQQHRLVTRYIQPNLFKHIGHVSSLRPTLLDPYIV